MKLYTYQKTMTASTASAWAAPAGWAAWPVEAFGLSFADMNDLIRRVTPAQLSRMADAEQATEGAAVRLDSVGCARRYRIRAGCTVLGHQLRGPRGRIGAVP